MLSSILRQISAAAARRGDRLLNLNRLSPNQLSCTGLCLLSAATSVSSKLTFKGINPVTLDFSVTTPKKNIIFDDPYLKKRPINEVPIIPILSYIDQTNNNQTTPVEDPTIIIEKQAARLIGIRKKKMKKHKLKKLRKKMKFVYAKRRHRRETLKEKAFQAELMGRIREAEKFDPVVYAKTKLEKANEVLIPKKYEKYPDFIAQQLIERNAAKRAKVLEKIERNKKISFKVSDYDL